MSDEYFGPIGHCIYCGATTYVPGRNQAPAREHIIPEGISGNLVLLEASCQHCERIINPWETRLLKGALLGSKTHLGLTTKRPSERPKELPLFDPRNERRVGGRERKVMIPIRDYPISLILARFSAPRLFNPAIPYEILFDGAWIHFFTEPNYDLLRKKHDLIEFGTSSLDIFSLCRTLAKIAHAFTMATFSLEEFIPTLPHYVIGNYDAFCLHYVGGISEAPPPGPLLHEISIEPATSEQWEYIVVRVRLFARYGAPIYRVVSGRRRQPNKPKEVLLEEALAGRRFDKTIFDPRSSSPIPEGLWHQGAPSSDAAPPQGYSRHIRAKVTPQRVG